MKRPLPTDSIWNCPIDECGGEVRARREENLENAIARHNSVRHGIRREYTGRDRIRREATSMPQDQIAKIRSVLGPKMLDMTVPNDSAVRTDEPQFIRQKVRVTDSSATLHRLYELFNRNRKSA